MTRALGLFLALVLVMVLTGCGGQPAPARPTVFAAASLTEAFTKIGRSYPASFNFGGSATLANQIQAGAPGDVFASADQANMQIVVQSGVAAGSPRDFARNKLAIAVQPGNPKGIKGFADLSRPDVNLVVCLPSVPCGAFQQKTRVPLKPKSQELDVKAVLSKVVLGEADAGVVYITDIKAAGSRVQGVDIADGDNVISTYPIVALSKGGSGFVDFVLSPAGQEILRSYGFLPSA
jgi:molybdate transport system substrate-binding protein